MQPRVDVSVDPEGYLLARATETEIIGTNVNDFSAGFRAEVLERYPRLDITESFLACFQGQAKRKPDSSAAASVRSGLSTENGGEPTGFLILPGGQARRRVRHRRQPSANGAKAGVGRFL